MNRAWIAAATLMAASATASASDVGVSVSVNQPGLYGRIDIGNAPQPALVYQQPMVIAPPPVAVVQQPLYLHVPPGHAKHWAKHCAEYNACGQPVYFVQEGWYQNVYAARQAPRYERDDDEDGDRGHGHGKGRGHHKHDD